MQRPDINTRESDMTSSEDALDMMPLEWLLNPGELPFPGRVVQPRTKPPSTQALSRNWPPTAGHWCTVPGAGVRGVLTLAQQNIVVLTIP